MKFNGTVLAAALLAAASPQAATAAPERPAASNERFNKAEREAGEILTTLDVNRLPSDQDYARAKREALEALRPRVRDATLLGLIDSVRHLALLFEGQSDESLAIGKDVLARHPHFSHIYPTALWAAVYARRPGDAIDLLERAASNVK